MTLSARVVTAISSKHSFIAMASVRTYILTPNFDHDPSSSPIQIGNLIADPLKPTKYLSLPPSPPPTKTTSQTSLSLSRSWGSSMNAGVWTNFLSFAETSVKGSNGVELTQSFDIDALETRQLRDEPQDDDPALLTRLQEPKVQAAIRSGLYGARPVYLISGLKIARGLTVQREEKRTRGAAVGGGVPIIKGISAGADIGREKTTGASSSFKAAGEEGEVIFAYQVHVIKPKGKKASKLTANVLETDAAFLHGEDEGSGDIVGGLQVTPLDLESLQNEDDDYDSAEEEEMIRSMEVTGADNEKCICVVAQN